MLLKNKRLSDDTQLSMQLREAIARAYEVFADQRIGFPLGVCHCNCCCTEANERALVDTPLRELSSDLLSEYTNSAHGYDEYADGHALRHFLPRYFELIARNDPPHYGDLSHCLVRLGSANYRRSWSAREIDAIDRYFDALLEDKLGDITLTEWPAGWRLSYPISELIEMVVLAGADVARLLATWTAAPDPGAALHAAALLSEDLTVHEGEPALHSAVLNDNASARCEIGAFLVSKQMSARLERCFFALDGAPRLQAILSDSQSYVDGLLQVRRS